MTSRVNQAIDILFIGDITENVILTSRAGTPEGFITAGRGSICANTTAGNLWMKFTGSGNTGWKLVTQAA